MGRIRHRAPRGLRARVRAHRRGFSFLELLTVVALLAGLAAGLLAAYSSVMQSSELTSAGNSLNALLGEARDAAVSRSMPVEVRLYDLPGSVDPTAAYRAAQLHWVKVDGTRPAIETVSYLPAAIVLDATAQHSSVIASDPVTAVPDASDPNMNAQTRVFHFLADGSTDLTPGAAWVLTLRAATQSNPASFPANWFSITLDPVTGRTEVFQP